MINNTMILIFLLIIMILSISLSFNLLTKSSIVYRPKYTKLITKTILYSSTTSSISNNSSTTSSISNDSSTTSSTSNNSSTTSSTSNNNNSNNNNFPIFDYIKPIISNIKPYIDRLKSSISKLGLNNKFKKEDIAKLGLFTFMSYGWVSNVSYITCLIISWIIHGKEYGLSPLAAGQWKYFLTIYAALWAANNVLRPFRVTFALFLAPYFEKWVDSVEKRTKFKRATATAIVIFLFNICGTVSYLVGGLFLATKLAGVPLLP